MTTSDPVYLANVASAFLGAMREAQEMADSGETGAPLAELVRHARELQEIMVEELQNSTLEAKEYAGDLLLELGERLQRLEKIIHN